MKTSRRKPEPTIALINIVFLKLIFFLVAGTLAQPLDPNLKLVSTKDLAHTPPESALVVHPDGRLSFQGSDILDTAAFMALRDDSDTVVRLVPDKDLPARALVAIGRQLREAGASEIIIVTERGLE